MISGTQSGWTNSSPILHCKHVDPGKKALRKLGNRIRKLRLERGWSQESFAFEVDLARSYIGGVERGERNLSFINVARIAGALNVSISTLCEGVPNVPLPGLKPGPLSGASKRLTETSAH